jgi:serine/threonine protein kinase
MQLQPGFAPELDSLAWREVQDLVQSFRQAFRRGERPAIEDYAPATGRCRTAALLELTHEEMELRIKAGERFCIEEHVAQFIELAADPTALAELADAESALRRQIAAGLGRTATEQPEPADSEPHQPMRIGRYELRDVVGQGAFGVVYRAWDLELNRLVALKRPRCGVLDAPEAVERFVREARAAATLRHPHIVAVFDAGQFEGTPYLVTALIEGQDLAHELARRKPRFRQSAQWIAALADALADAHEQGTIHRDIKPSNVLIDKDGQAYLTDFGLAKSSAAGATLTLDGQMLGTPAYMAPEQIAEPNERVDARTDIYSLGVVLYELLTGTRPFQGSERMLLLRIQDEEPTPPRRLDDSVPRDLETIGLKAMAKEPAHRYADAAALAADLRRYLHGEPVHARPLGPFHAFWRKCRRRPAVSSLAAALLVAVALGFGGVTWQWRRADLQRRQALNALSSGFSTLSLAIELGNRDPNNADARRQRELFLGSLRDSLQHQSRTYPELNSTLMSVTMGALKFLYRTAPREEALGAHEKIRSALEGLARDDLPSLSFRDAFARCLAGEATILLRMGRVDLAEARVRESLEQRQLYLAMAASRPEEDAVRTGVRQAWFEADQDLAWEETALGRKSEAISCRRRALALARELMREELSTSRAALRLASIQWDLANQVKDDRPDEAISLFRGAAETIEPTPAASPTNPAVRELLANYRFWLAIMEDRQNHVKVAEVEFNRAAALCEEVLRVRPLDPEVHCWLSTCYHVLGRLHADTGRPRESLELFRKAIALRENLYRLEPSKTRWRDDCAGSWHRLAELLENLGQINEAVDACRASLAHERFAYVRNSDDVTRRNSLDGRLRHLFRLQIALGRRAEAVAVAEERKNLWPDDAAVAWTAAFQIAQAACVMPPGEQALASILSRERRRHAMLAFEALQHAGRCLRRESGLAATH